MMGLLPVRRPWRRGPEVAARPRVDLRQLATTWALAGVLVVVALTFHVLSDGLFISSRNIPLLLRQPSVTAIVAVGVSLVIIARQIDLSIGSAVGLCGILAAWLMNEHGVPVAGAIALTVAAGAAMGLIQGVAVAALAIPAFIVTLGGLLVFRGVGLTINDGNTIAGFPESFSQLGQGEIAYVAAAVAAGLAVVIVAAFAILPALLHRRRVRPAAVARVLGACVAAVCLLVLIDPDVGLPIPVVIAGAVALVLGVVAGLTPFGRRLYAIGGNPAAAELAGIHVGRTTLWVFLVMGVLYAVAGIVLVARLDGAPPEGALFLELDAIAAAVIGGTSLAGGVGSVRGAVLGALLLASVSNGLTLLGVGSFYQLIATGLILVLAVFADVRLRGRS